MSRAAHIALGLALALPASGLAEGARLELSCNDTTGVTTHFTIAPRETDASGKGPITVTRDGESFEGLAASDHGPFQFGTDTDHFALIIEGETDTGQLTVTLHHASATKSTLTQFTCETDF